MDEAYEQEGEEISDVESVEVVERGPLRASVRVKRRWRNSTIQQTYRLLAGSRRLDVESYVDWHERRVLLRTLFPLAVRSHETTCETMFAVRPRRTATRPGTPPFEVSAHRVWHLRAGSAKPSSTRKYGHTPGTVLGITLLRNPSTPPLRAEGDTALPTRFPTPWTGPRPGRGGVF